VASKSSLVYKNMLTFIAGIQCGGEYISSIHGAGPALSVL
jgi:hypothetical protein